MSRFALTRLALPFGLLALPLLSGPLIAQQPDASAANQPAGSTAADTTSPTLDNVVVVLDASGSMRESLRGRDGQRRSRMEAAQDAIITVLRNLPPRTNVGVLVFSGSNVEGEAVSASSNRRGSLSARWLQPLGPLNLAELEPRLRRIRPSGGTPLGMAMAEGADALLAQRKGQFGYGTFRLLIVTDGEANDARLLERNLPDVMSRGFRVDAIGVGMKTTHSLARKVSSYRSADDEQALTRAVQEVLGEVGSAAAGQDASGDETFAAIASLPNEVSMAFINALRPGGDQPIGQPADAASPDAPPQPASPAQAASASPPPQPPPSPPPAQTPPPGGSPGMSVGTVALVAAFIGLFIMAKLSRLLNRVSPSGPGRGHRYGNRW